MKKAMQILMLQEIKHEASNLTERGWVTIEELEDFENLYKAYHDLGGNGTGTKLKNDVEKLEVRRCRTQN